MTQASSSILDFEATTRNAVIVLIAATTAVRLLFAGTLGLGIDEAYAVATSRQLQMGYFDHPPFAWWMTWAIRAVTGSESALVARLPFIVAFGLTTWFTYALTRLLYGLRAGFWAAIAVNIPPAIAWTSGTWVLPDGPLYAALMGGAYAVARVLFVPRQSPLLWLAAGAAGGIAMLSKLHGVFLFVGVLVFLASSPRHRYWLATPWPYAGALLALALFSPALLWNAQHDWISFTFQASRGEARQFSIGAFLAVLGGQMAYLLPLLWATLIVVWFGAMRRGPANSRDWLLVCIATGPIVVFTFTAFWARKVLPHWAMPGYLMLMPLLGREIARGLALAHRWVTPWLWLCVGTTAIVLPIVIALSLLPWPTMTLRGGKPLPDPLFETLDWRDLSAELERRGYLGRADLVVVSPRWYEAGKIDVALKGKAPVLCLSEDPRGYGVNVRAPSFIGRDAVIVASNFPPEAAAGLYGRYFARIAAEPDLTLTRAGKPTLRLNIYKADRLSAPPPGTRPDLLDPLGVWRKRAL